MSIERPVNTAEARLALGQFFVDILADLAESDDPDDSSPEELTAMEEDWRDISDTFLMSLQVEIRSVVVLEDGSVQMATMLTLPPAME